MAGKSLSNAYTPQPRQPLHDRNNDGAYMMFFATKLRRNWSKSATVLCVLIASESLVGCSSINYRQAAYSALRHEDCKRNEVEIFCTRSYQREYNEYERMRNEFLRESRATEKSSPLWRHQATTSAAL